MTTEAKVGIFTLVGIALLGFIVIHLSGFRAGADKSYTIYVGFTQVMGLNPGAKVRFAGVEAGTVKELTTDGLGARVELRIQPEIKIPKDAKISTAMNGVMGEKFVSITPVDTKNPEYLKNGDYVIGTPEQGMDTMMEGMNKAIDQVQELLASLNDVLGNPAVKGSVVQSAENVRDITGNIKEMTGVMSRVSVNNEANANKMVQNLTQMTAGLMQASEGVNRLVQNFSGDGEEGANIRLTLVNIASASQRIENMAAHLEGFVTDPQTADDLKTTLHNAREVSQKARGMLDSFGGVKLEPAVDVLYSGKNSDWATNFNLDIYRDPGSFLTIGLDDIGEDNRFNAQAGIRRGNLAGRAGAMDGKLGVGLDAYAGDRWKFSADAYNINDVTLKLKAQYKLTSDTYLLGQLNDLNRSEKRAAYFGIRHTF